MNTIPINAMSINNNIKNTQSLMSLSITSVVNNSVDPVATRLNCKDSDIKKLGSTHEYGVYTDVTRFIELFATDGMITNASDNIKLAFDENVANDKVDVEYSSKTNADILVGELSSHTKLKLG